MNKPKIIAYLKPSCGWSQGVRAIMRKYDLPVPRIGTLSTIPASARR